MSIALEKGSRYDADEHSSMSTERRAKRSSVSDAPDDGSLDPEMTRLVNRQIALALGRDITVALSRWSGSHYKLRIEQSVVPASASPKLEHKASMPSPKKSKNPNAVLDREELVGADDAHVEERKKALKLERQRSQRLFFEELERRREHKRYLAMAYKARDIRM
jgi:hypothetical protein